MPDIDVHDQTQDLAELDSAFGFGDVVYLIQVEAERFACNNATLADGQVIDGLATFMSADDAYSYMGLDMVRGISGEPVAKKFQEAREIALTKPRLMALLLFKGGSIVDIHFVR